MTMAFDSVDGTRLAYHRRGVGRPLVVLPGGPMRDSAYLEDMGGLTAYRELVLLDLRGTGESAVPADRSTYRCDRQVDDVEALRQHLGWERLDLAGHSGGATLAILYAVRHPDRIASLTLINPSPAAVGLEITNEDRREIAELRRGEPWFPPAYAAFERIWSGDYADANWEAIAPFSHGRWHPDFRELGEKNDEAAAAYYADGAFDPTAVRSAIARLQVPVRLFAGEYDVHLPPKRAAEYAGLFADAELIVRPGCGHSLWLDDPAWFAGHLDGQ